MVQRPQRMKVQNAYVLSSVSSRVAATVVFVRGVLRKLSSEEVLGGSVPLGLPWQPSDASSGPNPSVVASR